jgi:hypothetical protein
MIAESIITRVLWLRLPIFGAMIPPESALFAIGIRNKKKCKVHRADRGSKNTINPIVNCSRKTPMKILTGNAMMIAGTSGKTKLRRDHPSKNALCQ